MASEKAEKKGKYLIDTSALYPMLMKGITLDPNKFVISTLTEYEIGNVLWKESKRKKIKDPERVAAIFADSIKELQKVPIGSISEILALAIDRNLSFYDASYSFIAETEHFILVSEDKELLKSTKNAIGIDKIE